MLPTIKDATDRLRFPNPRRRRPLAKNIWIQTALKFFRFDEIEKFFR
jgi:hypothetical protein